MAYTTINKSTVQMNTVQYTGNGSTNNITGVGFRPDWVWLKKMNGAVSNRMFDSVRGATNRIFTNETDAQNQNTDSLTAFASDGFTLGSAGGVNNNSDTYISWNWLAGGTSPSQTYTVKVVSDSGNKYRFDDFGTSAVTLDLQEGGTYTFDQSDSSNAGHPLRFSTTANGTHGGGSEYTTGVTTNGTPGSSGAYTRITVAASAPTLYYYCTQHSGMGGQANTNSTFGSSNFSGNVQTTVSANTTAGFSIVKYTGTDDINTFGHGLSKAPKMIIIKNLSTAGNWVVYHDAINFPSDDLLYFNLNNAVNQHNPTFNNTVPGASFFTLGNYSLSNNLNDSHIAYCFTDIQGFSAFNTYTGNGNANGPFVYTGFKPTWLLIKRTNSANSWEIRDNVRDTFNPADDRLFSDSSGANDADNEGADFLSNGFKIRNSGNGCNQNGSTYAVMAFGQTMVGSNDVPATAR